MWREGDARVALRYELKSKLLASHLVTPIVIPYIIHTYSPLRSVDDGSYQATVAWESPNPTLAKERLGV